MEAKTVVTFTISGKIKNIKGALKRLDGNGVLKLMNDCLTNRDVEISAYECKKGHEKLPNSSIVLTGEDVTVINLIA